MDEEQLTQILHAFFDSQQAKMSEIIRSYIDDAIEPIRTTLYGNGQEGLATKIGIQEARCEACLAQGAKLDSIEESLHQIQGTLLRPQVKPIVEDASQKTLRTALIVIAVVAALFVAGYGANRIGVRLPVGIGVDQVDGAE